MLNTPMTEKPAHVPENLVRDFDIYNIECTDAEWQLAVHKKLHAQGMPEVFWTPRNGGHWVATRAPIIQSVLKDSDRFSSRRITMPSTETPNPPFAPLMIDPPEHVKYRQLLMPALSPQKVAKLGKKARELSIQLIDGFKEKGECEFIGDFATHLPIAIFMSMVDLPEEDRSSLLEMANTLVRGQDEEKIMQARMQLATYATQKIQERKDNPGTDIISMLTQAKIDGKSVDDGILMGMVTLLLTAGLDTVAMVLGFIAKFLASNPEYRQQLIENPEKIPEAVEEMLRRFPIANLGRQAITDTTLNGVEIKADEMILLPTAAFGLDDKHYDNPEKVDFDRENKIHETFGDGPHRCMGSMLARVEMRVFLEEWLERIPNFSIKPGANLEVLAVGVAGITSLPLVWDV